MPVKSTPIACPLNTGGGLEGADDPKAWAGPVMRVSMADDSKLVDVPQPATFTLKNKEAIPESLSVLLYQHGSIRQTAVHKDWLHELITQCVSVMTENVPDPSSAASVKPMTIAPFGEVAFMPTGQHSKKKIYFFLII